MEGFISQNIFLSEAKRRFGESTAEVEWFDFLTRCFQRGKVRDRMGGEGKKVGAMKRKKEEEDMMTRGKKRKSEGEVTEEKMKKEKEGRMKIEIKMKKD